MLSFHTHPSAACVQLSPKQSVQTINHSCTAETMQPGSLFTWFYFLFGEQRSHVLPQILQLPLLSTVCKDQFYAHAPLNRQQNIPNLFTNALPLERQPATSLKVIRLELHNLWEAYSRLPTTHCQHDFLIIQALLLWRPAETQASKGRTLDGVVADLPSQSPED